MGPLTWFSDDFKYVLLPYEYARPGHYPKAYHAWNVRDYRKFMTPDLTDSSFWIEVSVHIIFTTTPRKSTHTLHHSISHFECRFSPRTETYLSRTKHEMHQYKDGMNKEVDRFNELIKYELNKPIPMDEEDNSENDVCHGHWFSRLILTWKLNHSFNSFSVARGIGQRVR